LFIPRSLFEALQDKGKVIEMRRMGMTKRDPSFLMAAVAGISMGLSAPATSIADEKAADVKCWGINGCCSDAKCSVASGDLNAIQTLLGEKEFKSRFGKSEAHSCGAHAKCGASSNIINWLPTSLEECKAQGGYLVNESGTPKKKTAKKA
jgi:hypothetical protein